MSLNVFVKENLVSGFQNGSFSKEQVNIFSVNYLEKGILSQVDFDEIQTALNPVLEGDLIE